MTITYLKAASALTIGECGSVLVSILPKNLFTKFLKGKIQTQVLKSNRNSLFCYQMRKNSSSVLAPGCPSLVVLCSSRGQSLRARSQSCSSLRSEEFIFLSSQKSAATNFVYSYFTELVRIQPVAISPFEQEPAAFYCDFAEMTLLSKCCRIEPSQSWKTLLFLDV